MESFKEEESTDVEHVKYIVSKVEKPADEKDKKREPFKPYKTTRSNVHDPDKEKQRKQHKNWEVTAATPPPIVHSAVKFINLNESLKIQKEQAEKLQVVNLINRLPGHSYRHTSWQMNFFRKFRLSTQQKD